MKKKFSFASIANLALLEELYRSYSTDPESVDPSWRHFFEGMQFASLSAPLLKGQESPDLRIYHLIEAYRTYGHLLARFNPLEQARVDEVEELSLRKWHFSQSDLSALFPTCGFLPKAEAPLSEILAALQATYCARIGVEYMGMVDPALEAWLQKRIEPFFELRLQREDKLEILRALNKAELFESFIHTKYVGQKRFSLEGEETLIPMLAAILESGADLGVEQVCLGMAHRGRLNVLANILQKSYAHIFHEFEDFYIPELFEGTGDVKYHKGFQGKLPLKSGKQIELFLEANPSHLESVDPVVQGRVRALQQQRGERGRESVMPILLHGDASLAGQGVVYETLELARLNGYSTGGTIHIVINNQIGFTTLPKDARSSRYCTDIAKTIGAPIFHVNAEDPEGCVAVSKIAMELRQKFHCDLFIDLVGYRKYGHNESDEPSFTQPLHYQQIRSKKSVREIYRAQLIEEGVLDREEASSLETLFKNNLHAALDSVKSAPPQAAPPPKQKKTAPPFCKTAVDAKVLHTIAKRFCTPPKNFHLHPKVARHVKERLEMIEQKPDSPTIDWGMAEHLAYATLLWEGIHIRLSGQDSRRGTFSHRHAIWVDQKDARHYFPLSHLKKEQAPFDVFNSPLSEFAVLGFDFGYSTAYPQSLVIWEAQFGDFSNGAQIIIDQYIASSEQKWGESSNLCLKLPHGYEGQGPEHSSARIERFLQLSADENMRIVNATLPHQLFHLLRRQALSPQKKPLIIFTPKALLRHPLCLSPLEAFTQGEFAEILDDPIAPKKVKRLLLCSGKVYYDLVAEREKRGVTQLAILRIEQLYPFDIKQIEALLEKYKGCKEFMWVQEEQENMGAWGYIEPLFRKHFMLSLSYVGRAPSASPAAGSHALHKQQQLVMMQEAFKGL